MGPRGQSLRVRLPALTSAILAVSFAGAILITYQLLLFAGRADLDDVLEREQRRFERSVPEIAEQLADDRAAEGRAPNATFRQAARTYLTLSPTTTVYLSVVRIDGRVLSAENGPEDLDRLQRDGRLPRSPDNRIETIETTTGDVRSLSTPVSLGGRKVATFQVAGELERIQQDAVDSMGRLALAALVSLLIGGTLLAITLRRVLAPLRDLSGAARATELQELTMRVPEPAQQDEVGSLARDFNRMLDRLEQAAEDRREFMASVSHELRTPITIARGYIETIGSTAGDQEALEETAAVVREELLRMGRLVEDLMALASSEAEGFVVVGPIDLPQFFADLRLRLTGLGVEDVRVVEPPSVTVAGDADRLAQALLNLVINADVHTPDGTPIEVDARREGDCVALSVVDHGPGIDPAVEDAVFEPFVKAESMGTHKSTGLGLAVVKAIAHAHGGKLDLETGADGTTVTIAIGPLLGAQDAAESLEDAGAGSPTASSSEPLSSTQRGRSA